MFSLNITCAQGITFLRKLPRLREFPTSAINFKDMAVFNHSVKCVPKKNPNKLKMCYNFFTCLCMQYLYNDN